MVTDSEILEVQFVTRCEWCRHSFFHPVSLRLDCSTGLSIGDANNCPAFYREPGADDNRE